MVDNFNGYCDLRLFLDDLFGRDVPPPALPSRFGHALGGYVLPEYEPVVRSLRLLHPKHCTPDLPVRVGLSDEDKALYEKVARDQCHLPTCVSFAISTALGLQVRRAWGLLATDIEFSPAYLHLYTGEPGNAGRRVSRMFEILEEEGALPCEERLFAYKSNLEMLRTWPGGEGTEPWRWRTPEQAQNAHDLAERFGTPEVKGLDVEDIADLKAHLAAGWSVVVGTSVTHELQTDPGFRTYGMASVPLPGDERPNSGHAWLLVGYDHVDGNDKWKYQGHFVALNSWGLNEPSRSAYGKGLYALPFAFVLSEGHEAYALRYQRPARRRR